ncbi:MAG: hypothetical protein DRH11_14310 [Deltaproteobacteria bacterium]|nr:MAG: hypothetical protein DRH11_14310 [Deltaproteobacteria bacterium]
MKVLITGSRYWSNWKLMNSRLSRLPHDTLIIHGGCRGADRMADQIARKIGLPTPRVYPANWDTYGKGAGPIRNQQMLDENPDIDLVIAFHEDIAKSKGTRDMIRKAKKKGLRVEIVNGDRRPYIKRR